MADLQRLRAAFKARLDDFAAAMSADFGRRSRHESLLSDGFAVLQEIDHARQHLRRWMQPASRAIDWLFWPARGELRYRPLGVVGVIGTWNYPLNMTLVPLATVLAAGNRAMVKPSEHAPRTAELLKALLSELFPEEKVATVIGGPEVAVAFAALPFDHLMFTGSTQVGRLVAQAAARNLTPVTLELGGKSPTVIADGYPIESAAQRIAFGKFLNAGQTFVAPDYVLLPKARIPSFVDALRRYVAERYERPGASDDFSSIVNERQYQRLSGYLEDARARGAELIALGEGDPKARVLAPTIVLNAPDDCRVMQEEIFGPVLPIVEAETIDAAIAYVNARPRPLAFYLFDHDRARIERVLNRVTAGGVAINETVLQFAQNELPVGGVGPSGMGAYHGHTGFRTFSKEMPVFYQARFSSLALLQPPYKRLADFVLRFLTR
jgi:coniferyl-aldehyde dehydrogenase